MGGLLWRRNILCLRPRGGAGQGFRKCGADTTRAISSNKANVPGGLTAEPVSETKPTCRPGAGDRGLKGRSQLYKQSQSAEG